MPQNMPKNTSKCTFTKNRKMLQNFKNGDKDSVKKSNIKDSKKTTKARNSKIGSKKLKKQDQPPKWIKAQ